MSDMSYTFIEGEAVVEISWRLLEVTTHVARYGIESTLKKNRATGFLKNWQLNAKKIIV